MQQADGSWSKIDYEKGGGYILLPAESGTLTFMVEQTEMNWTLFAVGMEVAAGMLVLAAIMLRRNRRTLKSKNQQIADKENG